MDTSTTVSLLSPVIIFMKNAYLDELIENCTFSVTDIMTVGT
jgi:hypothetical protein